MDYYKATTIALKLESTIELNKITAGYGTSSQQRHSLEKIIELA
jgi:hypothetical protein